MKKIWLCRSVLASIITFSAMAGSAYAAAGDCSRLYGMPVESKEYSSVLAGCIIEMETMNASDNMSASREDVSVYEARKQWDSCLIEMIDAFDDKISPASDIATALQDECQFEYEVLVKITHGPNRSRLAKAYQERTRATKKQVTRLVLAMRAQKRKQDYPKW